MHAKHGFVGQRVGGDMNFGKSRGAGVVGDREEFEDGVRAEADSSKEARGTTEVVALLMSRSQNARAYTVGL
jgi:hypothetical protein